MAIVKIEAVSALVAAIATAVPALAGKITVHQEVPAKIETFPNLALVLSGSLPFEPAQRLMQADLGGNVVVWNVGAFTGPMQWRLTTTTGRERAVLEQALFNYVLGRFGSPGIVVVPVSSGGGLDWVSAFEFESSQWLDQRALEREYESVLTFTAVLPALVTESPVYDINTLKLGYTSDLATAFDPSTFATSPSIELVLINEDGTITPA